jgi:hypothetical protein
MHCSLGVLKRGALSHTFVWKLRITVNFFTLVVEVLTASESFNSRHLTKAQWFGEFEMGRKGLPESGGFGTGAADQRRPGASNLFIESVGAWFELLPA